MAGPYTIFFKPDEDEGHKLAPEVVAEIQAVAPSTVTAGSIVASKMADDSVETRALQDLAVTTDKLADASVTNPKLAPECVTEDKIEDDAVTRAKAGVGVITIVDSTGSPISLEAMRVTETQMAAIVSPDSGILYLISA